MTSNSTQNTSLPASGGSFSLSGRVALVTGSSKGLGKAIAIGLGRAGAKVALNYFNDRTKAEKTFAEFSKTGAEGILARADVTDAKDVERMVAETVKTLGPIDILVLNATCEQPQLPIEQYEWAFYQRMLDFFIKSPFLLTKACLAHMKQKKWGRIVNIGSEVFQRGVGNFSAYVAAKGGQNGWSRSMATELARFGITVNMISPGWIPVERHENDSQDAKDGYLAMVPSGRWGVPEDIAGATVFLASESAGFITGQNICINGGLTVA
ncbi:MAG: 3-oxoacyl-ACP reductase FabG [Verrucomicrobia bacterium]|nr:3-oxoacyl-ACP reductase FabG [Verrucomicrobiota bacterium]